MTEDYKITVRYQLVGTEEQMDALEDWLRKNNVGVLMAKVVSR